MEERRPSTRSKGDLAHLDIEVTNQRENHGRQPGKTEFDLEELYDAPSNVGSDTWQQEAVLVTKKYKPVALKTKPVLTTLPSNFRIIHDIKGDLLEGIPELSPYPEDFEPTGRYSLERKLKIDEIHGEHFLWAEERKLMHPFYDATE